LDTSLQKNVSSMKGGNGRAETPASRFAWRSLAAPDFRHEHGLTVCTDQCSRRPDLMGNVIVALAVVISAWAILHIVRFFRIVRDLRGLRVVTCPETGLAEAVVFDLRHALTTGLCRRTPSIRLRACSRSTDRQRCGERCVAQATDLASTPRAMMVRKVTGQPCAYCGRAIECIAFLDHYAAFLQPDGSTVEWPQVPPARLRDTIAERPPVCWNCHIAESFRRKHPELVTDRSWRRP
jgi:hypothetical protein